MNDDDLHLRERIEKEINFARKNPRLFSLKATKIISNFKGNVWKVDNTEITTIEGPKALIEAIAFLNTNPCLDPLIMQKEINQSVDNKFDNIIGNKDDEDLIYRLNCNCIAFGELFELINYENISSFSVVLSLIMCDGDKERQARKILFCKSIKHIGAISGLIPSSQKKCVIINFVQHFYKFDQKIPDSIFKSYEKEINENIKYTKEKFAQKKILDKFEEKILLQSISSATNNLNADDFILSLTRPKYKVYQMINENFNSKAHLDQFFDQNERQIPYNNTFDEEALEALPEGVVKVVSRHISGKNMKHLIRKKVYYQDWTIDTLIYKQ